MEKSTRKSVYDDLKKYCHLAKDHESVEVTEWTNAEGFDAYISDRERISLTWGEFKALKKLAKRLYK